VEIEAKFSLPDLAAFRRLLAAGELAGYTLATSQVQHVRDTYLDTAAGHVRAAGYALRQREAATGVLLTLKALTPAAGAVHQRQEVEQVIPAALPPQEWPAGPVRERVQAWAGDAPLLRLFSLEQTRHARPVHQGERLIAELSLDQVHMAAGERVQAFLELEVELAGQGTTEDLAAIVACLQEEWHLPPQPRSKFARGLAFFESAGALLSPAERVIGEAIAHRADLHGRRARALLALAGGATQAEAGHIAGMSERRVRHWLAAFRRQRLGVFPERVLAAASQATTPAAPPTPALAVAPEAAALPPETGGAGAPAAGPGLLPDDTMAEAARKTLLFHFQRMLDHEAGTHLGQDIEELHDMRVATRRMRAALRLFADYLDPETMAPFAKALRRTGRTLGAVRDLDIFHDKAQRYLDRLPPEQPAGLEPLLAAWEVRYQQARQELLGYLDGERYARFTAGFGEFLAMPGAGARPALSAGGEPRPNLLRHVVPGVLYQALAAVRAYDEWLRTPEVPLSRYHQLRIASKGLRYALEFFREVLGLEARELISRMKALQDHLGDLQDAVVACGILRDFLTWGTWGHGAGTRPDWPAEPIVAPGVAAYLAARQLEIQRLVAAFPPVWALVQGPEFAQLLAASVAPLY
jgi:CHAD domain-containing protein/uncharacterized protein YjbK